MCSCPYKNVTSTELKLKEICESELISLKKRLLHAYMGVCDQSDIASMLAYTKFQHDIFITFRDVSGAGLAVTHRDINTAKHTGNLICILLTVRR